MHNLLVTLSLTLSFTLVLSAFAISAPQKGVAAKPGITNQSARAQPGTHSKAQQNNPDKTPMNQALPSPPTVQGPISVIVEPSADEKAQRAREQAKTIIEKLSDVLRDPTRWPEIVMSLATVIAVIFAWCAYRETRGQRKAAEEQVKQMEAQLAQAKLEFAEARRPRLYVDTLTVKNFYPGYQPVFFLRIANVGPVPAERVRVFIEIKHQGGSARPTGEGNEILIPANGHRDYDFIAEFTLPRNMIELNGWKLQVSGTVTQVEQKTESEPINYCFKYNDSRRWPLPDGMPLFVPCDFDHRRVISATPRAASTAAATSIGTAKVTTETAIPVVSPEAKPEDRQ